MEAVAATVVLAIVVASFNNSELALLLHLALTTGNLNVSVGTCKG